MAIEKISEDILLVELPSAKSKMTEELSTVGEMVGDQCTYDVIIDFRRVELLNSWNVSTLLALQSLLHGGGDQLVFCNVNVVTKCIFTVVGLRKVFTFANNKEAALATLSNSKLPTSVC